ncbi:MAG: PD-(D/E)XK nuclease family protein [Candidatus Omnitrophica bacterium]|nr:PD-(D/E)XK nuclease family protein [Candidatus Omnitrophota bacterium]
MDRPPMFPYTLNSAVDKLLKKEFDLLRENKEAHELMKKYKIDAIPAQHPELDDWRNNFKGVRYLYNPTNLLIFGAIDDLWQNPAEEYIVVDYKATAKTEEIIALDKDWQDGYKRQMEIYQWLLRQNGYKISKTGYFVYCNGRLAAEKFDGKLEFDITIIPYEGNDGWVENTVKDIHSCLNSNEIPSADEDCDYCAYIDSANEVMK